MGRGGDNFLNFNDMNEHGDYKQLVSINEDDDSVRDVAIMWLDRNRIFFVGNTEPNTDEDTLYRVRWNQMAEQSDNQETDYVETVLNMHVTIEAYYSACGSIDRHNRQHQDNLKIERKIRTKDWWKQVNKCIFGMIIFDAMNVHQACAGPEDI